MAADVAERFSKWYAKLGGLEDGCPQWTIGFQGWSPSKGLGAKPTEAKAFLLTRRYASAVLAVIVCMYVCHKLMCY